MTGQTRSRAIDGTNPASVLSSANSGFTLVELLVSLLLFALISLAGVALVETIIGVQQRTETRSERLSEVQRALYLLTADIEQLSAGPLIDGGTLVFTRSSAVGDYPVVYRFADGALYRQAGETELPVLTGVAGLQLRFFKNGIWMQDPMTQEDLARPRAVEVLLELAPRPGESTGPVRRVIELPDEQ